MPLIHSGSDSALHQNIRTLMHEIGKSPHVQSRAQAIAVAESVKRRGRALGGVNTSPITGYFARQALRNIPHAPRIHSGPITGATMGRGDKVPMRVSPGSYVLPADHVSGLGQGNTMAGFKVLNNMFGGGPGGMKLPSVPKGGVHMPHLATGGSADPIEIQAADGEYVIPPESIMRKFGSLKHGHKLLDAWVVEQRKQHVDKLKKLPGPVRD